MTFSDKILPVSPLPQTGDLTTGYSDDPPDAGPGPGGWIAVLFVSLFAFLLASFPARNSDLWAHLAAGRDLAQAARSPGQIFSGPASIQAGPGWLYDLLCYGVYTSVGGSGLVFLKAILVALLGLVVLLMSRGNGQGWWIATVCTALALLAMSVRLLLQPATVSCFFLALAFWLAGRQGSGVRGQESGGRLTGYLPSWPLLAVFVLWTNLDGGFLFGLAAVGLVWLGRLLDQGSGVRGQESGVRSQGTGGGVLGFVVGLGVLAAVCLVNPWHIHAFRLPQELGWLGGHELITAQVTSPFQAGYLTNFGPTPAGLAYFPLLALGLASFLLNFPPWHWQRFLPWLGLAVLSVLQARMVPFFAVVAGPVLAWNLQDFFARHAESERRQAPSWRHTVLGLRALTVVLGLVFLTCAWPGWLQAPPFGPRHWAGVPVAGLERGAAAARRWHQEGKLGAEMRALYLSQDAKAAFAWFCPEEKGVWDERLAEGILGLPSGTENWEEQMRSAGINHLILYDSHRGRLFAALSALLAAPEQWPLLYREGDLAVFGWRDPARVGSGDTFRGWELDLNQLAFHPAEEKKAPPHVPNREQRRWWEVFWKPAPPRPIERDEATLWLLQAEALRPSAPYQDLIAWETLQSAALVAGAGSWPGVPFPGPSSDLQMRLVVLRPPIPESGVKGQESGVRSQGAGVSGPEAELPPLTRLIFAWQGRFGRQRDDIPPALLYLAVRAARRAVAVNPEDAQAYLVLGESYLRLLQDTRERVWGERLPELIQLRRAQAAAALNQAISLKPDLAQAYLHLASLHREMGYLDLTLQHLRSYLKLLRQAGPAGTNAEQYQAQIAGYEREVIRLGQAVEEQEDAYERGSVQLKRQDRASLALTKGLAGKALGLLLESDIAAFGREGMVLELDLLLKTGRAKDILNWTGAREEAALGTSGYRSLRFYALAAVGDYEEALEDWGRARPNQGPRLRQVVAALVSQEILDECPGSGSLPWLLWKTFPRLQFSSRMATLGRTIRQEATANVVKGLLALEQGNVEEARVAFLLALETWKDEAAAASGAGLDFNGRVAAQDCLEWLK